MKVDVDFNEVYLNSCNDLQRQRNTVLGSELTELRHSLRSRGHNYQLQRIEFDLFKN